MKNYLTQREYTGQNFDTLVASGFTEDDSFLTFKQALKIEGISGKSLKGLKKAATLIMVREKEDKETGKKYKYPYYFSVFDAKQVLARTNKKGS